MSPRLSLSLLSTLSLLGLAACSSPAPAPAPRTPAPGAAPAAAAHSPAAAAPVASGAGTPTAARPQRPAARARPKPRVDEDREARVREAEALANRERARTARVADAPAPDDDADRLQEEVRHMSEDELVANFRQSSEELRRGLESKNLDLLSREELLTAKELFVRADREYRAAQWRLTRVREDTERPGDVERYVDAQLEGQVVTQARRDQLVAYTRRVTVQRLKQEEQELREVRTWTQRALSTIQTALSRVEAEPRAVSAAPPPPVEPEGEKNVYERCKSSVVRVEASGGFGSGFVVDASGLVITNLHVVGRATRVTARTFGGTRCSARVVASSRDLDLALLRVEGLPADCPPLPFAAAAARVGDEVFAVGHPIGLDWSVTVGRLSAYRGERLQMQTPVNPGNSGGPLLDSKGEVVGVVVAGYRGTDEVSLEGLNLAVRGDLAKSFLETNREAK